MNTYEEGQKYQDFIQEKILEHLHFSIGLFTSKENQYRGESMAGVEIKYDKRFKDTGNLYIEYAEKTSPNNPEYIHSGIKKKDNTWIYCIGDYEQAFLITKENLLTLFFADEKRKQNWMSNKIMSFVETETSRGMLLQIKWLKKNGLIAYHLVFNSKDASLQKQQSNP